MGHLRSLSSRLVNEVSAPDSVALPDTTTPLVAGIRARLESLSATERRVANVVLAAGDQLLYRSASDIADAADAALSTVVRTCQNLGFGGFQDLKLSMARDNRPVTPEELQDDVHRNDPAPVVLAKLKDAARDAVSYGVDHVDDAEFDAAVTALTGANRVLCLGVGTSAPLAQDIAYRMLWIDLRADAPSDAHAQHVTATLLQPGDVALIVSHTGSTRETVTAASAAHDAGATVIAVTSFPRSPLTEHADINLVAATRETDYRVEALTSRIAHLVVLDALWVATALASGTEALGTSRRINDVISTHRY